MTDDLIRTLRTAGFTLREAEIYLSLLKLGETLPPEVVADTGLKRGTVHFCLEALVEKELVVSRPHPNRKTAKLYKPVTPNAVLGRQQQSARELEAVLPRLMTLNPRSVGTPEISTYFGADGIRQVWNAHLNSGTDILVFFTQDYIKGVESWSSDTLTDSSMDLEFRRRRLSNKQWIRGIVPYEPNQKRAKELGVWEPQREQLKLKIEGSSAYRQYSLVDRNECPHEEEVVIFGDSVSFTSYFDGTSWVIKNPAFARNYRHTFFKVFNDALQVEHKLISRTDRDFMDAHAVEISNERS